MEIVYKTKIKGRRNIIFIILLLFVLCTAPAYAVGEGDGGGGGPGVPLYMDWSYPSDGETNVSITPIIQCKYSHNVAQYDVRDRNAKLFSLKNLDGTVVPITIYMADVQLEFDKRQYIYIIPVRPLKNNTSYIVTAEIGVQAKNGMATEEIQTFSFTTGRTTVPLSISDMETTTVGTITTEKMVSDKTRKTVFKTTGESILSHDEVTADKSKKTEPVKKQTFSKDATRVSAWIAGLALFTIVIISFIISIIRKNKDNELSSSD